MTAVDIDPRRVSHVRALVSISNITPAVSIDVICANASDLSFLKSRYDLALVTDFTSESVICEVARLTVPGGHIVFETFRNRGDNWRTLPKKGSLYNLLSSSFEHLTYEEQDAGPPDAGRVTVRCLARRLEP